MNKKMILFDLDGTLLPQDQDQFIGAYFSLLVKKLGEIGLPCSTPEEQKALATAVWAGTKAMLKNDGSCTNEERFFAAFSSVTGVDAFPLKPEFDKFYENEFQAIGRICGNNPLIPKMIERIKNSGCRVAIATNPLFPLIANVQRLKWAGLSLDDFEYCTCYENSKFCKPSLEYYKRLLEYLNVSAEDCLMVGNDVGDDMVVRELGMDVFLVTDCLINHDNVDIEHFPHGSWEDFEKFFFQHQ